MDEKDELLAGQEPEADEPAEAEETVIVPEEEYEIPSNEDDSEADTPAEQQKPRANGLLIALVAILSVAVVVLGILLIIKSSRQKEPAPETPASPAANGEGEKQDDGAISYNPSAEGQQDAEEDTPFVPAVSYMKTEDELKASADLTVAECGEMPITNKELSFFYWQSFYSVVNYYYNNYGSYMYYVIDPQGALDAQSPDGENSWDMLMMDYALDQYADIARVYTEAKKAGYTLNEAQQAEYEEMKASLEATAATAGYDNTDDYVRLTFGPHISAEDYLSFQYKYMYATDYCNDYIDSITYSEEEIGAFYDENADAYLTKGIEKTNAAVCDIRHILICPEKVELAAEDAGYQDAVNAANAAAREKAENVYNEWLAGEMTEESFAALANEHSEDPGSNQTGGLYEDVYPGEMVAEFNNWCFDETRQPGDSGIVETSYGFHIMFFSSKESEPYWHSVVDADLHNNAYNDYLDSLSEQYPMTKYLDNAGVYPCNLSM